SFTTTEAPSAANSLAVAPPIPRPDPVSTITRPSSMPMGSPSPYNVVFKGSLRVSITTQCRLVFNLHESGSLPATLETLNWNNGARLGANGGAVVFARELALLELLAGTAGS